jgi:transposase
MSTIPVSLTQEQFEQYIRPGLSVAKRGYECSIPLNKGFNYILYRLHTGCQWERLPIDNDPDDPTKKKSATLASIPTTANGVGMAVWSGCLHTALCAFVTRSTPTT